MRCLPCVLCVALSVVACVPEVPTSLLTGTAPNAVEHVVCEDGPRFVVAASGDARLDVIDPKTGSNASVFLGVGSSPWDIAVVNTERGPRALVTLSQARAVAVVDPCEGTELSRTVDDELVEMAPVTLRQPADVDGDGVVETTVTRMVPRTPQAVAANGDDVVVVFANLLEFSTAADAPMLAGPGSVRRYRLVDDVLVPGAREVLPGCDNPGGVSLRGAGYVVSCAGRFVVSDVGHGKASDGAVFVVDDDGVRALPVTETPGPVFAQGNTIITGDLLDGAVRSYDVVEGARTAVRHVVVDDIQSAFALTFDDEELVVGWFDGRVMRDPLGAEEDIVTAQSPLRGLVDLVRVDGELWGLMTLSAELTRLTP